MLRNEVRAYRNRRGWSQDELARRCGLSRAGISAIETGRLVPSTAAALALGAALGCSVEALFRLSGAESAEKATAWAWAPGSQDGRYWSAHVGGRLRLYPVEFSPLGLVPHDGTCCDEAFHVVTEVDPSRTLVLATCDPAVGLLAAQLARTDGIRLLVLTRSSRAALDLLSRGLVHAAGVHWARSDQPEKNAAFACETLRAGTENSYQLVRAADWEEGIALAQSLKLSSIRAVLSAKLRWIGRESGSAAQRCLEEVWEQSKNSRPLRALYRASGHRGVAEAIRASWADAGVCLRLASAEADLAFIGVRQEAYDICMGDSLIDDPRGRSLISALQSSGLRRAIGDLPGYDSSRTGELKRVSIAPG
jgi:molybdate-binding protein/DNA-binding XRE family transcriptional regulator